MFSVQCSGAAFGLQPPKPPRLKHLHDYWDISGNNRPYTLNQNPAYIAMAGTPTCLHTILRSTSSFLGCYQTIIIRCGVTVHWYTWVHMYTCVISQWWVSGLMACKLISFLLPCPADEISVCKVLHSVENRRSVMEWRWKRWKHFCHTFWVWDAFSRW